jgi:hypothetical protein
MVLQAAAQTGCRDPVWAVLLVLNFLIQIILAIAYGLPLLGESSDDGSEDVVRSTSGQGLSSKEMLILLAACLGISLVTSALMTCCINRFAENLVQITVWASVALNVVLAIASLFLNTFLAILWLVFAVLGVCFWLSVRNRIPFAVAHLKISAEVTRRYPMTVIWAYASLLMGAAYILVWALAVAGVSSSMIKGRTDPSEPSAMEGVVYVLQVLTLYWGTNFFRFGLHVVVAGTVGAWWVQTDAKDPTWGSIRRTYTTSFGTVSFAAFIIAVIQTIKQLVREAEQRARRSGNPAAACCLLLLRCVIQCIEDIARYLSTYALVRVALFGEPVVEAGKKTYAMFVEKGWTAVINDVIIDRTLGLAVLLFGAISGAAGAGISFLVVPNAGEDARGTITLLCGLLGFLMGIGCCSIVSMVVESGVKTAFVAFGEQPDALQANHPEHFTRITDAWAQFYPSALVDSGYRSRYHIHVAEPVTGPQSGDRRALP